MFEPEDREKEFLTKLDEKIIKEDFPERMHLKNLNLNRPNEKVDEISDLQIKWTYERLKSENPNFPKQNPEEQKSKELYESIKSVLELMKKEFLEVMFIYQYKRH